jgi:Tfp pilus assembly protein PilF
LIKRLSPAEQAGIKKSLGEISADVDEQSALSQLLLAGFYEQNNLLIDAISAYEQAVRLAPDVPFYKESYDEFLMRHNIK